MIVATLGKPEFKGTQGWLEKWKKRFAIKQLKISGKSGEVQGESSKSSCLDKTNGSIVWYLSTHCKVFTTLMP